MKTKPIIGLFTFGIVVTLLSCWGLPGTVAAQDTSALENAELIAEAHEPGVQPAPPRIFHPDRYSMLERGYRIHNPSQYELLQLALPAQSGPGWTTFDADQPDKELEVSYQFSVNDSLNSAYNQPQPVYSRRLFETAGQGEVKTELKTHDPQTGAPYFGLKLSIPFGGGG